jgi:hypothetical protein
MYSFYINRVEGEVKEGVVGWCLLRELFIHFGKNSLMQDNTYFKLVLNAKDFLMVRFFFSGLLFILFLLECMWIYCNAWDLSFMSKPMNILLNVCSYLRFMFKYFTLAS